MKKIMKLAGEIAAVAAAAAAGGAAVVGGISYSLFARTMKRGGRLPVLPGAGDGTDPGEAMRQEGRDWAVAHRGNGSRLAVTSGGTELAGYYYDQGADKSVILVHGIAGSYVDRLSSAELYYSQGYNVLAVDCRGHGESGGRFRTMGYRDGEDVLCWVNYLIREKKQEFLVLDGISMGAAAVLNAAGSGRLPWQVRGVVADSPFSSIHNLFEHHLEHSLKLSSFPLLNLVEWFCQRFAHVSATENSPLDNVKKIQVPVLFIHGMADDYVPYEMGVQLNRECRSLKRLLSVKGAGHVQSCRKEPELYRNTITQFLYTLEL